MDMLRFITAGNIDDGKSTLTGRLLLDTGNLKTDILHSVVSDTNEINLAHIADGLRAEREQGITIDVAYKYFTTANRKFIVTDAPGHFQYTRNLLTGASNADVMIILVDARNGVTEQTRRHSLVAAFLGIPHILVAVNKMDAVGYDKRIFNSIVTNYNEIVSKLHLNNITVVPISALHGDNVSFSSKRMEWYEGTTILEYLQQITPCYPDFGELRYAIQFSMNGNGRKVYGGRLLSGALGRDNGVMVWPQKCVRHISSIFSGFDEMERAVQGDNVNICVDAETDLQRGCVITDINTQIKCAKKIVADICWLEEINPLKIGAKYLLRLGTQEIPCNITEVSSVTNIDTFALQSPVAPITANQFANVIIQAHEEVVFDPYSVFKLNGRGVLIDPASNYTVAAVTLTDAA